MNDFKDWDLSHQTPPLSPQSTWITAAELDMAPSKKAEAPFSKDERVLCFHHEMLYEAKVLDSKQTDDKESWQYRIHYKGWKNTVSWSFFEHIFSPFWALHWLCMFLNFVLSIDTVPNLEIPLAKRRTCLSAFSDDVVLHYLSSSILAGSLADIYTLLSERMQCWPRGHSGMIGFPRTECESSMMKTENLQLSFIIRWRACSRRDLRLLAARRVTWRMALISALHEEVKNAILLKWDGEGAETGIMTSSM